MSYRDLEIWKLARQAAVVVHRMTLQNLPKLEMYEEGSQIRRSAKSKSLTNEIVYRDLRTQLDLLGRKLNVFIDSVERSHRIDRRDIPNPESRIAHLVS